MGYDDSALPAGRAVLSPVLVVLNSMYGSPDSAWGWGAGAGLHAAVFPVCVFGGVVSHAW